MASPAGEAEGTFALPFTEQDLEILVLKITGSVSSTRRRVRRLESVEQRLLEDFGGQLFDAVFTGSVRTCLERSLTAAEDADAGLRLRLRVAAPLENIPWEFLYAREYGFLCLSPETPLVRYVAMPRSVPPFPVRPPLRILAMLSAPSDVPGLQNEEEWDKLQTSLSHLIARGMVQLDRLPVGSLAALQRPMRQQQYHVLHFVGHGLYDEDADDGALVLEDETGRARLVTGRDLGTMLRGYRSLRLVVLNACEGARSSVDDPFGGVAQALVRQGVPAVIAMQFEISDPAAVVFSQSFYEAVADLLPADVAVVEARKAIFAAENDVEWATPVIYLRSPDGTIFEEASDPPPAPPPPVDDPSEQRRRQFAEWNRAAALALEQDRWNDAIAALEQLTAAGDNDPDTARRLLYARDRKQQTEPATQPVIAEVRDRLLAKLIDLSLYLILILFLAPSADGGELDTDDWLRFGVLAATVAIYEIVLTALWGCTLGKYVLRLKVVRRRDRRPVGWTESLLRWFVQFLAWVACLVGAAVLYASLLWDKSELHQGWHDRVAGTLVVKLPPR
ncbi:CHAT domain-containing protein [Kribbella sp. NPDC003557]|uniref:CHAT domain-containing protein n=1 Tax=Kribbella sp. NPDC003557 TaxID=3154449 RepID=UPI0033A9C7BB